MRTGNHLEFNQQTLHYLNKQIIRRRLQIVLGKKLIPYRISILFNLFDDHYSCSPLILNVSKVRISIVCLHVLIFKDRIHKACSIQCMLNFIIVFVTKYFFLFKNGLICLVTNFIILGSERRWRNETLFFFLNIDQLW